MGFDLVIPVSKMVINRIDDPNPGGAVWIEADGLTFPESDWFDLPLSVLGSFGDAIRESIESGEGEFYFFEGYGFIKIIYKSSENKESALIYGIREFYSEECGNLTESIEFEICTPMANLKDLYMRRLSELRQWASASKSSSLNTLNSFREF